MKKTFQLLLIIFVCGCNSNRHKSLTQLSLAKKHYIDEKYDSTITHLNDAVRFDSLNSEAYFYLSKVNYEIENYSESLKYLSIAEKQKFNSDSIETLKLKILFNMEKYDEFIAFSNKLIGKNSSDYKLYFNKASALYNKSSDVASEDAKVELLKEALDNVNISLKLDKKDNEIVLLRGAIRYSLLDIKGAISDFDSIIIKEKKDSSTLSIAYRYKGLATQESNDLIYAESLLDSAIILNKGHAILYVNRGDIRIDLNKNVSACEDYRKALELGDKYAVDKLREHCKQ